MDPKEVNRNKYFLGIAKAVAQDSKCLRRKFGAILVKGDKIIATGYNGSARGAPNCSNYGCLKDKYKMPQGSGYEVCRAGPLHAEANAIINAARHHGGIEGTIMYLSGIISKTGGVTEANPCKNCQKIIVNSGIEKVIIETPAGFKEYKTELWVRSAYQTEDKDIASPYVNPRS